MRVLGRIAWIALVWMTAASTLLAGLPRVECICPDGSVKPVCTGHSTKDTTCCCGGSCCSGTPGGKGCCAAAKKAGCCGESRQESKEPQKPEGGGAVRPQSPDAAPSHHGRVEGKCCQRTLAATAPVAVGKFEPAGPKHLTAMTFLPAFASFAMQLTQGRAANSLPWQIYAHPPTDLVIAFQHFVI